MLTAYDVVILGEMTLTTDASHDVHQLGDGRRQSHRDATGQEARRRCSDLTDAAATLTEGYLLVEHAAAPGAGIVSQTMQYHGAADRYTLNGATSVATLYSNATTATANPAVTLRSVGLTGGQAAAFTYDLAKSIVLHAPRQPGMGGTGARRSGADPLRRYVLRRCPAGLGRSTKVAIPQADEQQRLLANLIGHMNSDRRLLPRFWYFPRGEKAVVVMTGDDHANNGTAGRFDFYNNNSTANCSVADWECIRATSYIFTTPITPGQVSAYTADGFEIGVHISTNATTTPRRRCSQLCRRSVASFSGLFPACPRR